MRWGIRPYTPIQLVAFVISFGLAWRAWRHRRTRGAVAFASLMVVVSSWTFLNVLQVGAEGFSTKAFLSNLQYLPIAFLPVAWLVFVLSYIERKEWLTPKRLAALLVVPVLANLFVWLNPGGSFRALSLVNDTLVVEYGPLFWIHTIYAYLLLLVASFLLLLFIVHLPDFYRGQGLLLLMALLFPVAGNLIYVTGHSPLKGIDLTPLSFTVTGVLLTLDIFHFHLFDRSPVAFDTIMGAMRDPVLILDGEFRVLSLNPTAQGLLGCSREEVVGELLPRVWSEASQLLLPHLVGDPVCTDVAFKSRGEEGRRFYELQTSPLADDAGWVVVLRDVTDRKGVEADLRVQKGIFEKVLTVTRATAQALTLDVTLHNVLDALMELTGGEGGSIFLLDEEGKVTRDLIALGDSEYMDDFRVADRIVNEGLAAWVIRHRQPVWVDDVDQEERWVQFSDLPSIRSTISAPIVEGERVLGIININHSTVGKFTEADAKLVELAGHHIALLIRNARLYDQQRALAIRQSTIATVLHTAGGYLDEEAVVRVAVRVVARLTGWAVVAVLLPDEGENSLVIRAAAGDGTNLDVLSIPVAEGVCGRAFRSGQTQYVMDVSRDPDYISRNPEVQSELAVPIRRGERILGVLNVENEGVNAFDSHDILLGESLAEALALALDNAALYAETLRFADAIAEERSRLRALIHSSVHGIIMLGLDGRVRVVNRTVLEVLGLEGEVKDWTGVSMQEILEATEGGADAAVYEALAEMARVRMRDEEVARGTFELGARFIRWLSLPVHMAQRSLGRLVLFYDITEERLLERMREDLTRTLVHDLRSPLSIISGALEFIQLGQERLLPEEGEMIHLASDATVQMLELIDAILDISHLESGRMPLEQAPVSFSPLIRAVTRAHMPLLQDKEQDLEVEIEPDLPLVSVDSGLVQRVIQNLLSNAIKFTPPEGQISVRARYVDGEEPSVILSVQDTGPGVSSDVRGRLFQKFSTGRVRGRGSGLGLAFCKMVAEAHGGRVWLEESTESGSTFSFAIPVVSVPQEKV